ncbi:MAG TPA: hypothetical protein VHU86_07435 [Solirubrobacterales bacterium]|jgi:hypothetical protein|nr:hypothetical protein [Solirubrobacterales bacterium]
MTFSKQDLLDALLDLAPASAAVANYCDHVEHNECAEIEDVREAARVLRDTALSLCDIARIDPVDLYAERLAVIEARNVHHSQDSHDGAAAARGIGEWRALQLVQDAHDYAYHYDVVGLTKSEQLRHYALHLAKLVGACAEAADGRLAHDDFLARRVADMLLFGMKLATVTSEKLPAETIATVHRIRAVA